MKPYNMNYISETTLQRLIDCGLDTTAIPHNPMRFTLEEALDWLKHTHGIWVSCALKSHKYSAEINRYRYGRQVGATLILNKKYNTKEEAKYGAVDFIAFYILTTNHYAQHRD